jgi:hypothetical protein
MVYGLSGAKLEKKKKICLILDIEITLFNKEKVWFS